MSVSCAKRIKASFSDRKIVLKKPLSLSLSLVLHCLEGLGFRSPFIIKNRRTRMGRVVSPTGVTFFLEIENLISETST